MNQWPWSQWFVKYYEQRELWGPLELFMRQTGHEVGGDGQKSPPEIDKIFSDVAHFTRTARKTCERCENSLVIHAGARIVTKTDLPSFVTAMCC